MRWLIAKAVKRIEHEIPERPLLHACCAEDHFGTVNVDIRPEVHPDVVADITKLLPFPDNSFAAAFADFPWTAAWKREVGAAMRELLRVAPVVYTISPWTYGSSSCTLDWVYVAWQPGVQQALLFSRYIRKQSKKLTDAPIPPTDKSVGILGVN